MQSGCSHRTRSAQSVADGFYFQAYPTATGSSGASAGSIQRTDIKDDDMHSRRQAGNAVFDKLHGWMRIAPQNFPT